MGIKETIVGHKLYLDANLFIYTLEEVAPWVEVTSQIFAAVDAGECTAVASELALAECLVKPFELGRDEVVRQYLDLLQNRRFFTVLPISRDLLIEASRLRATTRLKLPDAIHAATALGQGCGFIVTNDDRFRVVPGIQTLYLRDFVTQP
ncbi:MAG TPA: PIN domain-containing protein [Candidatus Binatia bacterium]|nr:PIN domain-containing protein [Candidatus Binatia bacterium]